MRRAFGKEGPLRDAAAEPAEAEALEHLLLIGSYKNHRTGMCRWTNPRREICPPRVARFKTDFIAIATISSFAHARAERQPLPGGHQH